MLSPQTPPATSFSQLHRDLTSLSPLVSHYDNILKTKDTSLSIAVIPSVES